MRLFAPFPVLLLAVACSGGEDSDKVSTSTGDDTGAEGGGEEGGGEEGGGEGGSTDDRPGELPAYQMTGTLTWSLEFDEEAEANGYVDCSYSRDYSGTQVLDYGYLCADCEIIVKGTSTFTDGLDCYASVFGEETEPERTELWGLGDGLFFRTNRDQYSLGDLCEADYAEGEEVSLAWDSEYTITAGGVMVLAATGTLTYELDEDTLIPDPWAERTEPYACGWEQADPGTLTLDYHVAAGATFPNFSLLDQCGEWMRLWDLYGSYLVLDTSQPDCGPCRSMASGAEAFAEGLREEGIPVRVVSLMGNGLAAPWETPDSDTLESWVTDYGISDPVLYDRGVGYALFPEFAESFTGESFGYPTWLIVDPEMTLIYANIGFSSWSAVADVIRADAEGR